jgi:hypothetical protein
MADGVHAAIARVQAATPDSPEDRRIIEPQQVELRDPDDPMVGRRVRGEPYVACWGCRLSHIDS